MLTVPIKRLQNVLSSKTVAILVSFCSTCPNQTCLELLWSLSIELMSHLLMLDVNERVVSISEYSRLRLTALISTIVGSHESDVIRITGKCVVYHSFDTLDSKCTTAPLVLNGMKSYSASMPSSFALKGSSLIERP